MFFLALLDVFLVLVWLFIILIILAVLGLRIIQQYETSIVFRLGRYARTLSPGMNFIIPILEYTRTVDMRILTMDIPDQQVITKDNVPVRINGVVYFKVVNAENAIIKVQDYVYAVSQYAQTALRDVVGGMDLDQVLAEREKIGVEIEKIVEKESLTWGIEVTAIKLQDIDMPEDLKRLMSRQASSEREKRATIIKAEGDWIAAENLAKAAKIMSTTPGAMQLRTLQTVDGLGPTASNTVVIALPLELMDAIKAFGDAYKKVKK
ncbi:MAG: SPFH domain-containing protein [Candidatus Diapherotrites archaeon]